MKTRALSVYVITLMNSAKTTMMTILMKAKKHTKRQERALINRWAQEHMEQRTSR